jgi:membrane protein DedA with SNARE-associated domain
MFEQLVLAIESYPYLGVALVFLLCGLGLPLPEEIVLLAAGYLCAKLQLTLPLMMAWCAGAILLGDLIPYLLGRVFGVRLLRLRWLRHVITKQRLASFDRWFRRRGDWVILIARFIPGIRVVAFFTGGTMKMSWRRFLLLDGLGIVLIVPLLIWLGHRSANFIDRMIATVVKVERGILFGALGAAALGGLWYWLWRRRQRRNRGSGLTETFVQPRRVEPPAVDVPLGDAMVDDNPLGDEPAAEELPAGAPGQQPTGPAADDPASAPPPAPPAERGPANGTEASG